jgi:hypothetical protein
MCVMRYPICVHHVCSCTKRRVAMEVCPRAWSVGMEEKRCWGRRCA